MGNPNRRDTPSHLSAFTRRQLELRAAEAASKASGTPTTVPGGPSSTPPAARPQLKMPLEGKSAARAKPAAPVTFDFLRLFSDDAEKDAELTKIRANIYKYVWSRDRPDRASCDFVVSERGIKRNVHYANRRDTHGFKSPDTSLLFLNKRTSRDFFAYICRTNNLELEVNMKPHDTPDARSRMSALVKNFCTLSPAFRRHTNQISVKCHMTRVAANYEAALVIPRDDGGKLTVEKPELPACNRWALYAIAAEVSKYSLENKAGASLRVSVYFSERANNLSELVYCSLPFGPLNFTRWHLYGFWDSTHYPIRRNLVELCDRAYKHVVEMRARKAAASGEPSPRPACIVRPSDGGKTIDIGTKKSQPNARANTGTARGGDGSGKAQVGPAGGKAKAGAVRGPGGDGKIDGGGKTGAADGGGKTKAGATEGADDGKAGGDGKAKIGPTSGNKKTEAGATGGAGDGKAGRDGKAKTGPAGDNKKTEAGTSGGADDGKAGRDGKAKAGPAGDNEKTEAGSASVNGKTGTKITDGGGKTETADGGTKTGAKSDSKKENKDGSGRIGTGTASGNGNTKLGSAGVNGKTGVKTADGGEEAETKTGSNKEKSTDDSGRTGTGTASGKGNTEAGSIRTNGTTGAGTAGSNGKTKAGSASVNGMTEAKATDGDENTKSKADSSKENTDGNGRIETGTVNIDGNTKAGPASVDGETGAKTTVGGNKVEIKTGSDKESTGGGGRTGTGTASGKGNTEAGSTSANREAQAGPVSGNGKTMTGTIIGSGNTGKIAPLPLKFPANTPHAKDHGAGSATEKNSDSTTEPDRDPTKAFGKGRHGDATLPASTKIPQAAVELPLTFSSTYSAEFLPAAADAMPAIAAVPAAGTRTAWANGPPAWARTGATKRNAVPVKK